MLLLYFLRYILFELNFPARTQHNNNIEHDIVMPSVCTYSFASLLSFVALVLGVSLGKESRTSSVVRRSGGTLTNRNQAFFICEPAFGRHLRPRECILALSKLLTAGQQNPYGRQQWVPAHMPMTSSSVSLGCGMTWAEGSVLPFSDSLALKIELVVLHVA